MKIFDLNGEQINVTDLDLALMQADDYRHYNLTDPSKQEFVKRQQAY